MIFIERSYFGSCSLRCSLSGLSLRNKIRIGVPILPDSVKNYLRNPQANYPSQLAGDFLVRNGVRIFRGCYAFRPLVHKIGVLRMRRLAHLVAVRGLWEGDISK